MYSPRSECIRLEGGCVVRSSGMSRGPIHRECSQREGTTENNHSFISSRHCMSLLEHCEAVIADLCGVVMQMYRDVASSTSFQDPVLTSPWCRRENARSLGICTELHDTGHSSFLIVCRCFCTIFRGRMQGSRASMRSVMSVMFRKCWQKTR